jgi:tetratricopeptide (TPR) repeat protein
VHALGVLLDQQGESSTALQLFERSLAIWQELGDREMQARELNSLGIAHRHLGDLGSARSLLAFDRAAEVLQEALILDQEQGDLFGVTVDQRSLALVSLRAGRPQEARSLAIGHVRLRG